MVPMLQNKRGLRIRDAEDIGCGGLVLLGLIPSPNDGRAGCVRVRGFVSEYFYGGHVGVSCGWIMGVL